MLDLDYGTPGAAPAIPAYTPSVPISTGASPLPNPILTPQPNPTFSSSQTDLGTAITRALQNNPQYKQAMEFNTDDTKLALDRLAEDKKFYEQNYQLALQSLQKAGGGGSSGEAQAAALDALAKEQAAHTKKLSEEQLREVMASRGLASSGQVGFEQGELQYNYENLLKEIDLRADARRAAAASAASASRSNRATQLASMQLQYAQDMVKFGRNEQDIKTGAAREKGSILMSTGEKLAAAWWDADTGVYSGPGGEQWDRFGNPIGTAAAASAVTYTPPAPSSSPAADSLYAVSNIKNMGF